MSKRDLEVTKLESATAVFWAVCGQGFESILVDLCLQDRDGIDVLKFLKKIDPKFKVIFLNGHGSEQAQTGGRPGRLPT